MNWNAKNVKTNRSDITHTHTFIKIIHNIVKE